jgi:hypothetical protein
MATSNPKTGEQGVEVQASWVLVFNAKVTRTGPKGEILDVYDTGQMVGHAQHFSPKFRAAFAVFMKDQALVAYHRDRKSDAEHSNS